MTVKIIVIGKHTENIRQRFLSLPDAEVVFAGKNSDVREEDCRDAEIFVGFITPELAEKMPKLRFVQLYSAGANRYGWLPENVVLANAYGAYGESIGEHMLTTTLMAMKRMPDYLRMQKEQGLGC